jgi:hypothetical protein
MWSRPSRQYSFEDRLAEEKKRLEQQAALAPNGLLKDQLRREIRQLETASHLKEWVSSSGLQAPK